MVTRGLLLILFLLSAAQAAPARGDDLAVTCDDLLQSPETVALESNLLNYELMKKAVSPPQRVSFGSWNLNMLKRLAGAITAQDYALRASLLKTILTVYLKTEAAPDVFTLQEVWTPLVRRTLDEVATKAGYHVIDVLDKDSPHHGLQIWVRASAGFQILESGFQRLPRGKSFSAFEFGGRVWRGLLWAKLSLRDGQTVLVATTHLTPFARYSERRREQIDFATAKLETLRQNMDHVVMTGDFNIAADFSVDQKEAKALAKVRALYPYFAVRSGLRDTFRAVHTRDEDPGYTYNPSFLRALRIVSAKVHKRLDYIWASEQNEFVKLYVRASSVRFKEKWNAEGEPSVLGLFLADHYMLHSVIDFFRIGERPQN